MLDVAQKKLKCAIKKVSEGSVNSRLEIHSLFLEFMVDNSDPPIYRQCFPALLSLTRLHFLLYSLRLLFNIYHALSNPLMLD